jgi:hypothetical protein
MRIVLEVEEERVTAELKYDSMGRWDGVPLDDERRRFIAKR